MIDKEGRKSIRRLTKRGLSEAEIVRQTGYSRNAVRRYMKQGRIVISSIQRLERLIGYEITSNTPTGICPLCHNKVTMPCKACLTKMYNAMTDNPVSTDIVIKTDDEMLKALSEDKQVVLGVDLRPMEYARYFKIKKKKDRERRRRERQEKKQ